MDFQTVGNVVAVFLMIQGTAASQTGDRLQTPALVVRTPRMTLIRFGGRFSYAA